MLSRGKNTAYRRITDVEIVLSESRDEVSDPEEEVDSTSKSTARLTIWVGLRRPSPLDGEQRKVLQASACSFARKRRHASWEVANALTQASKTYHRTY